MASTVAKFWYTLTGSFVEILVVALESLIFLVFTAPAARTISGADTAKSFL